MGTYCVAHGTLCSMFRLEGEFGGEWIHVHVWLNPFTIHLKLSHCSSAIRQYKIKVFFLKKGMRYMKETSRILLKTDLD